MSAADHLRINQLASQRAVHSAFSWLPLHEPQLRRWQMEATAIPAPPFLEAQRSLWFCNQFKKLDLSNPHIDAEGNALAQLLPDSPPENSPVVLLSAHLDTVFPSGTDCTPREEDNRLLGPGTCDNAAGLAALLGLAAALRHAKIVPACTLLFAANVGEEGEGNLRGMRHLFSASPYASRIRAAIALEGGGNATVVNRALGSRRLRITVEGPGGHSWANAGRPNPILALSAALLAAARLPLPQNPRTTLNCGTIRGGTSVNSIPSSATADLDLRSTSVLQLDRTELAVLRALDETLAAENRGAKSAGVPHRDLQRDDLLRLHVQRIGERAAGALAESSPLYSSLRAVDRHLQIVTEPHMGSTDANLPLSLGIPALAIGAGGTGGGIHTLSEWHDPTGRDLALRRILLLLLDTCSLAAASAL